MTLTFDKWWKENTAGLSPDEMEFVKLAWTASRREALEEAAKECDGQAFAELCCDTYMDLANARPYEKMAKIIRALKYKDTL